MKIPTGTVVRIDDRCERTEKMCGMSDEMHRLKGTIQKVAWSDQETAELEGESYSWDVSDLHPVKTTKLKRKKSKYFDPKNLW